jgi:hypothetical protein
MAELLMVETLLRIMTEALSSAVELTTSTGVVRQLADAVVVERGLKTNFVRANFARSPHAHLTPPHKHLTSASQRLTPLKNLDFTIGSDLHS